MDTDEASEFVQTMRAGTFNGFHVLGRRYRDPTGELHWYIALLVEDGSCMIRRVLRGEVPEGLAEDECRAIAEAISFWEFLPASRPN